MNAREVRNVRIERGWMKTVCLLASALMLVVCGCHIPNRAYRSGLDPAMDTPPMITVTTPEPPKPGEAPKPWPEHPEAACDEKDLLNKPCLAFLEMDDFGEYWQRNVGGRPTQLNKILTLIAEAKQQDPAGTPLILTFIHGWKHSASQGKGSGGDDTNIIGVESALNELHSRKNLWQGHVVIGIYVSWRGGLISPYWPVSQQFTYWNREATAIRVGNSSLTDALIEISDAAKRTNNCKEGDPCYQSPACVNAAKMAQDPSNPGASMGCSPLLLMVGHSFGALVLERAMSQATITRMEGEWNDARTKGTSDTPDIVPLADLTIYVNSAAAATESKQVMDYLASSHFTYRPNNETDRPLFLSVTSEADLATSLLLKVGHAVPLLGYKWNGSMRASSAPPGNSPESTTSYARACFEPPDKDHPKGQGNVKYDLSESDYFMTTTGHKQALWSHAVTQTPIAASLPPDEPPCTPGSGETVATCKIGHYEYEIAPVKDRCNGTPYWAIQVQKELIPDHGTIFTERLIDFLTAFIPLQDRNGNATARPQLTRQ